MMHPEGPSNAEQTCMLLNFCEINQCREEVREAQAQVGIELVILLLQSAEYSVGQHILP